MDIILSCAFGDEAAKVCLPYTKNGETKMQPLGHILKSLLLFGVHRMCRWEIALQPLLILFFFRQEDREYLKNVGEVKKYASTLIKKRKETNNSQNDLLGILLEDENFKHNENEIIDECILFFIAGSQTLKSANTNLLYYLMKNDQPYQKLCNELKTKILDPYLMRSEELDKYEVSKIFNFDTIADLPYLSMCFNESLRIEPPVLLAGGQCFTKDVELLEGKYKIKAGIDLLVDVHNIHYNK